MGRLNSAYIPDRAHTLHQVIAPINSLTVAISPRKATITIRKADTRNLRATAHTESRTAPIPLTHPNSLLTAGRKRLPGGTGTGDIVIPTNRSTSKDRMAHPAAPLKAIVG